MPTITQHPSSNNADYVNSTDYKKLENRLRDVKCILDDNYEKVHAARKLRYAEIDIEAEREAQKIAPDELYVPQHIIESNIRKEQSSYVQYVTESPRAVILEDLDDLTTDLALLEKDLTKRLRFEGWQMGMYSNIDGFQMNGYNIMEVVYDDSLPGCIGHEMVQYGDFGFVCDTRDIQSVEMVVRTYYYTRTQLLALCDPNNKKPEDVWDTIQVNKIVEREPYMNTSTSDNLSDARERSLYPIHKLMFKVNGTVVVGWCSIGITDDWMRAPRPLYVGRRKLVQENVMQKGLRMLQGNQVPPSQEVYETQYPYFLYPYLISENDTIMELKGRVFLDQDTQEAVSSLLSSTCTQARRAAGLYFAKDESDPNDDVLLQKNVYFKQGSLINAKVKSFNIAAPDPGIFSAIQALVTGNRAETSQVAFATNNRKDSRKTAKELDIAQNQQQQLSTVQVVLFSHALRQQYQYQCGVIKSRVLAGLIKVTPDIAALYARNWVVKPSGDVDVMEKQQLVQMMMQAWPVVQTTAAAPIFLTDLLEKMFPAGAAKYVKAITDATAQAQSAQAQQMQQMMMQVQQLAGMIAHLGKHPELFSESGLLHVYPPIEVAAQQIEAMKKQQQKAQSQPQSQQPQMMAPQ